MRKRRLLSLPIFLMLLLAATNAAQANPTAPAPEDSDGDGLDDELEFQLGSDPSHPDTDTDGWGDLIELINGTDPCDANDYPQLSESNGAPAQTTRSAQRREATRQSAGVTVPVDVPDSDVLVYVPAGFDAVTPGSDAVTSSTVVPLAWS